MMQTKEEKQTALVLDAIIFAILGRKALKSIRDKDVTEGGFVPGAKKRRVTTTGRTYEPAQR
jgi:hypothetical protein